MRTLAFRAPNETTFHADGQQVPFYLQPTLGGPNDLRGYERYRFYYTDLGQKYGVVPPADYNYYWFSFDDESGNKAAAAGGSTSAVPSSLASLADGHFIGCTLTDAKEQRRSVTVIFRRHDNQWKTVGIERTSL
jgi:hypothetical protein